MENIELSYMLKTIEVCVTGKLADIKLKIVLGSILNLGGKVDCIVNAANSKLQHSGGLAGNLAQLAGPELERECQDYIRKYGPLSTSRSIITKPGNLSFKKIMHVVGPIIENGRGLL